MDHLLIRGGKRLQGTVQISGSKNSALPILAACLMGIGESLRAMGHLDAAVESRRSQPTVTDGNTAIARLEQPVGAFYAPSVA